jgi:hypothetical protein
MMSKFDDDIRRIAVLVNDLGDGRDGDAWGRLYRVLEAAGAVDKERDLRVLATLLKVYVEADGMLIAELEQALEDGAVKEIRALLSAIPDKEK